MKKYIQRYFPSIITSSKKSGIITCFLILSCCISCKKIVDIEPPVNSITTSQVFSTKDDATAALLGIYTLMATAGSYTNPTNAGMTILPGMSADELLPYAPSADLTAFYTNSLKPTTTLVSYFWIYFYPYLYQANAVIEGLEASTTISQSVKDELGGEAKFLRAFFNFYLVNLYGDIPLITTTDYNSNKLVSRTPSAQVYQSIIKDLKEAKNSLPADHTAGGGERTRANKWAAIALLARVYLYIGDFANAEAEATSIINNSGIYSLVSDPNKVFLKNSPEAILQWHNNAASNTTNRNATPEGFVLIPRDTTYLDSSTSSLFQNAPSFYLTDQLLNSFEAGDKRYTAWVQRYFYVAGGRRTYSYPYKYKTGPRETEVSDLVTEYYTVLRLAEQYLIRAEARAQLSNLSGAIADLNLIRGRAGLAILGSLGQSQVLSAIAQERRIELFAEWGHRWFDLKRTGKVETVFSTIPYKSNYQPHQKLYPIAESELRLAPNLSQTAGY